MSGILFFIFASCEPLSTDIQRRFQNLGNFYPSNWGSSEFSHNQNIMVRQDVHATCIYCALSMKINTRTMPQGMQRLWTHLFLRVWSVKTWRPPIRGIKMAQIVYTEGYTRSGISLVYICGIETRTTDVSAGQVSWWPRAYLTRVRHLPSNDCLIVYFYRTG